jgi:hypothetical protein
MEMSILLEKELDVTMFQPREELVYSLPIPCDFVEYWVERWSIVFLGTANFQA